MAAYSTWQIRTQQPGRFRHKSAPTPAAMTADAPSATLVDLMVYLQIAQEKRLNACHQPRKNRASVLMALF